jgi:hypothetical protein
MNSYIVICRDDACDGNPGPFVLATRTVFECKTAAELYCKTIAECRQPQVVEGRFDSLRFGEERGKEYFWANMLR